MCEVLGRSELSGVEEGVVDYIVFLHQLLPQFVIEVLKCCARISECCMPTITRWRQFVCKQERIASSAGVEARVDVENVIALKSFCESSCDCVMQKIYKVGFPNLVCLSSWSVRIN
jgi:hypothetical protein